jgi:hypothetical protein
MPAVLPDNTSDSAEDDRRSDGYKPGQDAKDRADRSVGLAVRDDR